MFIRAVMRVHEQFQFIRSQLLYERNSKGIFFYKIMLSRVVNYRKISTVAYIWVEHNSSNHRYLMRENRKIIHKNLKKII